MLSQRTLLLGLCGLFLLLIPLWHRLLAPVLRAPAITPLAPRQTESAALTGGFAMDTLTFVQFDAGKRQLLLSARHAFSKDTDKQILLSGVTAELYDKKQKTVHLQSNEAVYDTPRDEITLRRSVNIKTTDFTASTEELHYFPEVKLAETAKKVEINRPGLHITGTGLSLDMGAGELVLGGQGRVHCLLD